MGRQAEAWGVVEESVPRADFDARWRELARQVASAPRAVLAGIKIEQDEIGPVEIRDARKPDVKRQRSLIDQVQQRL